MDTQVFETTLKKDGFDEVVTRSLPAGQVVPPHSHPFAVRALVLEGEITLTVGEASRTYRAGEVFTMDAACEHTEQVGAAGVDYLVGRRH